MHQLTDEELVAKAREYLRRRRLEKMHGEKKSALGLEIRTEMARRGRGGVGDVLEVLGVRIRIKASTTNHFTVDAVRARLGRRASRFLVTVVDSTKLREAKVTGQLTAADKAEGKVSAEDLAACIGHVSTGRAYVDVDDLEAA